MKTLQEFITEARGGSIYKNTKTTLHFASVEALALYKWEFKGQISDGKYENSRPTWHWEWIRNTECKVDGKEYFEGQIHKVKYNFADFVGYAFSNNDKYYWAKRLIAYVAATKAYTDKDFANNNIEYDRYLIEPAYDALIENPDITYDEFVDGLADYKKRYLTNSVRFDEKVFDTIKDNMNISKSDLEEFVKSCQRTINNLDGE